jgi:hypothetical protein
MNAGNMYTAISARTISFKEYERLNELKLMQPLGRRPAVKADVLTICRSED